MKSDIIFRTVIAALLGITAYSAAYAQTYISTPVEISKEKVRIDGKICYSHVVLERQTLYSICKAYDVTAEDIYMFNPSVKEEGLKKNSIIIIPSKEAKEAKAAKEVMETENYSVAKQEKSESPAEIKEPTREDSDIRTARPQRIHIAKWYEDLDVIASQYGVSVEDIMAANNLTGRKLSKRHKLMIPYPGETPEAVPAQIETTATTETANATVQAEATETIVAPAIQAKTNATIILPLTNQEGEPNRNNMDFYSGALLAVYDLAEQGIDCNLNVYDLMDSNTPFSVESIKNSDIVIGPVSAADITRLFNIVSSPNAVVSPLDPRSEKLITEHPEMLQAPTPHIIQYQDLIKWMEEDFRDGDRVVMITEKGARQNGINSQMKEILDSTSLAYNPFSYSILEGRDVTEPLTALMTTEGANRILIASDSEAFVNDVIRNLNLLKYNNLDIVLYAPSRVRSFETIEVENFHNTSMHVSLGYYIDYDSSQVKDFLKKYRALYSTEPTQFAFQGYDITRYFLSLKARYGQNWKDMLNENPEEMLQSTFSFAKQPLGGYINTGIRRIIYDEGYQVRKVK